NSRGRGGAGGGQVNADLDAFSEADHDAGDVTLEAAVVVTFEVADEVKLKIDFLFGHRVGARNIEDGGLGENSLAVQDCKGGNHGKESVRPVPRSEERFFHSNFSWEPVHPSSCWWGGRARWIAFAATV